MAIATISDTRRTSHRTPIALISATRTHRTRRPVRATPSFSPTPVAARLNAAIPSIPADGPFPAVRAVYFRTLLITEGFTVELEHRFEVPVGIETAWSTVLDMEKVGPCFPGATLETVDGDSFTGSVKIKLGPIQLTYKGKATIVEKDPVAHRAKIEASGNASSASTAAMLVTATATLISPNRPAVDLITTLSITGRP